MALALQPLGPYRYRASDRSAAMLAVAREKAARAGSSVVFEQADFTDYRVAEPVDVALLLFDGLNYLLKPEASGRCFGARGRRCGPAACLSSTRARR
nr:class I SAM-dependent methyltransferase [Rhodothermus marinus]